MDKPISKLKTPQWMRFILDTTHTISCQVSYTFFFFFFFITTFLQLQIWISQPLLAFSANFCGNFTKKILIFPWYQHWNRNFGTQGIHWYHSHQNPWSLSPTISIWISLFWNGNSRNPVLAKSSVLLNSVGHHQISDF